jgi:hypothetical protein
MSRRASGRKPACTVAISPSRVGAVLAVIIAFLLVADVAGQISTFYFGHPAVLGLVSLFDLDTEANFPSWYSASALLMCAVVLAVIAVAKRQARDAYARHWIGLALGFVYLSADEEAGFHEIIGPLFAGVGHWLTQHVSGYFAYLGAYPVYTWVLPACAALVVIAVSYAKFLLALPRRSGVLMVISGVIFIGGAVGMEIVGARHVLLYGQHDPVYGTFVAIEETLEMAGIALFLVTLLQYAQAEIGAVRVQFGIPAAPEHPAAAPEYADPVPHRRSA